MKLEEKGYIMRLKNQIVLLSMLFAALVSVSFAESYGPEHDKVLHIFEGDDEPAAKVALWSKPDEFKVAVLYEGHRRDDYALHVCKVIHEEGLRGGILVHVLDADKLLKGNEWVVIGEARCE